HAPDDNCLCRKPKPSMLLEIADSFAVSPEAVTFVGDTATDMQAAKAANMKFVLVKTGKGDSTMRNLGEGERKRISVFSSLQFFVEALLNNQTDLLF
ncbi:MAG TPA: HAD family hydrolase, partial [Leucothrix sp.]|nr:HAD family hydrolase [Leucothrix sp.]